MIDSRSSNSVAMYNNNVSMSIALLIPANIMYSMAFVTHSWFELPGASYGLWLAEFCDYLRCQLIPAFFTEEPGNSIECGEYWLCVQIQSESMAKR